MQYLTPKTDWTSPDVVQSTDLNRIGINCQTARLGGGDALTVVSWAENLDIDMIHQTFYVTGTPSSTLKRILYTDGTTTRAPGNVIILIFGVAVTIDVTYSASGNYYPIQGYTSITAYQYDTVSFVFSGGAWFPIVSH